MMNFELLLLLDCGKLRRNSSKRKIVGLKLAGYARLLSSLTILFTCEAICAREEFRPSGGAGDQAATASALLRRIVILPPAKQATLQEDKDDCHHCAQRNRLYEKFSNETSCTIPRSSTTEAKRDLFAASEVLDPKKR